MTEKVLLILCDWFAPGFRAGGPIRSVVNMSLALAKTYQIKVLTTDRDLGDKEPYNEIETDQWVTFAPNVTVFYASPGKLNFSLIKRIIISSGAENVYLNSMYSRYFTIYPLIMKRLGLLKSQQLVLNPRGMLKSTAVDIKKGKKELFFNVFKSLSFHTKVTFHFTDQEEAREAIDRFGRSIQYDVTSNFPTQQADQPSPIRKEEGNLKLLFVGRVHPIKNLLLIIEALATQSGQIELTIVGPIEDQAYYDKCKKSETKLPDVIALNWVGEVQYQEVHKFYNNTHFLILPTQGENFGHAIFDAFSFGRPVIISDRTPWKNLKEKAVGWDVSLEVKEELANVIAQAVEMPSETYHQWSQSAYAYVVNYNKKSNLVEAYQMLFDRDSNFT